MDSPFRLFSAQHIAALLLIATASVGLALAARRWPASDPVLRKGLAVTLLVLAAAALTREMLRGELSVWSFAPLHLCDFALFLAAFALWTRHQPTAEVVYFWSLAGTSLAVVTPDVPLAFPHWRTIVYFALHGAVIASAVLLTVGSGLRPRPSAPWRVFLWTNAYALVVAIINAVTGANFLFLRAKPEAPTLLDYLGPWPVYILAVEALALVLFYLLALPWRRRSRRPPPH